MAISLIHTYANATENKHARPAGTKPGLVIWHETVSAGDDPMDTINWCMKRVYRYFDQATQTWKSIRVEASFNYLIARDGRIFLYVDPWLWIAWHAGVNTRVTLDGRTIAGGDLNLLAIGVELDGPNDGTPITEAQKQASIDLLRYFRDEFQIPIERKYHWTHAEAVAAISPSYKSDPRGANIDEIVRAAGLIVPTPDTRVLGLTTEQIITKPGMWFRSLQRHKADQRGFRLSSQQHIYEESLRLGIEPWFVLALARAETDMGRGGAGPDGRNWFNIREYSPNRPSVPGPDGRRFEKYGDVEHNFVRVLNYLDSTYNYLLGLHTPRAIIPVWAPKTDGNDPDKTIARMLSDAKYILEN